MPAVNTLIRYHTVLEHRPAIVITSRDGLLGAISPKLSPCRSPNPLTSVLPLPSGYHQKSLCWVQASAFLSFQINVLSCHSDPLRLGCRGYRPWRRA